MSETKEVKKIKVKLTGEDGNVFSIIGRVSMALRKSGDKEKSEEFTKKAFGCTSYGEVLNLVSEYVIIS